MKPEIRVLSEMSGPADIAVVWPEPLFHAGLDIQRNLRNHTAKLFLHGTAIVPFPHCGVQRFHAGHGRTVVEQPLIHTVLLLHGAGAALCEPN